MDLLNSINTENMFVSTSQQQSQLEDLSNKALSNGINLYINKDYKKAIQEFQRAIGLSPQSEYSVDASNYMANAYLQLGNTEKAIKAYQTASSLNPYRDDIHITLGNLYFADERYEEATHEYNEAVKLNPSANNYFSLGQAYLSSGQYSKAENQFNTVRRLTPQKANGSYGLGLVYSKQGLYDEAISRFKDAISLDEDFYDAYAELGYVYADTGQMDNAREQKAILEQNDTTLAYTLGQYIYKTDPPKFLTAYSTNFTYVKSANSTVASLDTYLENADTSKTFTMKFMFDKDMSRDSVENCLNWEISRASGTGPGEAYNFGFPIPSNEIQIAKYPDYVYYDSEEYTATVYFKITQNASADGTIDPSHIEFKFSGKDSYGFKMDTDYDQFTGFSGIA